MNVVAERMTGWLCQEAAGRPFFQVFHIIDGSTRQPCRSPIELAVQQDRTVGLAADSILIRRDGSESAIEDSAAPIHDRHGNITGAQIDLQTGEITKAWIDARLPAKRVAVNVSP